MAIQHRRGNYTNFDKDRLVPGELAVVQSGDITTPNGTGIYMCINSGNVQRLSTYEEVEEEIEQAMADSPTVQGHVQNAVENLFEEHPEWHADVRIDDGAVSESKLASNAVSTVKIKDNAVTAAKIAENAVSTSELDVDAVAEDNIQDGAVTEDKLAALSVSIQKIQNGAVTDNKLAYSVKPGIHNLLKGSVELNNFWTWRGTIERNIADPFGGTEAIKLTAISGSDSYFSSHPSLNVPLKFTGVAYRLSVWLRSTTITSFNVTLNNYSGRGIIMSVGTTWKQYHVDHIPTTLSTSNQVVFGGFSTFTTGSVEIYNPTVTIVQEEDFSIATEKTSPSTSDLFLMQNSTANHLKINYDDLANAILNRLTSKTYSDVAGDTQTLINAINKLQNGPGTELFYKHFSWPLATNTAADASVRDGAHARLFVSGNGTTSDKVLNLLYYPNGSSGGYTTNTIMDADGAFLPLYHKILSATNLQVTYSGSSVADKSTLVLTGTYTRNAKATSVLLIPRVADRGYFVNVAEAQSGTSTTWTVSATIRNVTGSAVTTASGRVYVVQIEK